MHERMVPVLELVIKDLVEMTAGGARHDFNQDIARRIGGVNGSIFSALTE
jgi:hypothetical protein